MAKTTSSAKPTTAPNTAAKKAPAKKAAPKKSASKKASPAPTKAAKAGPHVNPAAEAAARGTLPGARTPRAAPEDRKWAEAQHEHQDPRGPHAELKSEQKPAIHNYGQEKNRRPGRMNKVVNWFRKAPKHSQ